VTRKNCNYFIKSYFFHVYVPIHLTILKCPFFSKKMEQNTVIFLAGLGFLDSNSINSSLWPQFESKNSKFIQNSWYFWPRSGWVNFLLLWSDQPTLGLENFPFENPKLSIFCLRIKKIFAYLVKKYPGQSQVDPLFTADHKYARVGWGEGSSLLMR